MGNTFPHRFLSISKWLFLSLFLFLFLCIIIFFFNLAWHKSFSSFAPIKWVDVNCEMLRTMLKLYFVHVEQH